MTAPACLAAVLFAAPKPIAEISYITLVSNAGSLSVYTFSNASIGAAAANRKVAVAISARRAVSGRTVTGVTIGGQTATEVVSAITGGGSSSVIASIWVADVPTGTTGDIVVTLSGTMNHCVVSIYRLIGAGTVAETKNPTGSSVSEVSATLAAVTGGVIIGHLTVRDASSQTVTWTNLTKDNGINIEGSDHSSSAHGTVGALITAEIDIGTAEWLSLAMAMWNPA